MIHGNSLTRRLTFTLLIVLMFAPVVAMAQDRLPRIPADKLTDAQKKAIEEFKAARGVDISGPFIPLLRSPEVMTRARAMGDYLRFKSVLPPPLSEFVILLVSRQWTQQYEWSQHDPIALKAGISTEIVTAISEGRRPSGMSEEQQILYDFCTEVQRNQSVSDSTYAKAVAKLGEPGVIDTLGLMGYYTMLAMVLNTSRTPPDKGAPTLEHFPR